MVWKVSMRFPAQKLQREHLFLDHFSLKAILQLIIVLHTKTNKFSPFAYFSTSLFSEVPGPNVGIWSFDVSKEKKNASWHLILKFNLEQPLRFEFWKNFPTNTQIMFFTYLWNSSNHREKLIMTKSVHNLICFQTSYFTITSLHFSSFP